MARIAIVTFKFLVLRLEFFCIRYRNSIEEVTVLAEANSCNETSKGGVWYYRVCENVGEINRRIILPNQSINQSIERSVNRPFSQLNDQAVKRPIDESVNQLITQSCFVMLHGIALVLVRTFLHFSKLYCIALSFLNVLISFNLAATNFLPGSESKENH